MKKSTPTFSKDTLAFLLRAGRQKKNATWLEAPKNRVEYERVVQAPLAHLAKTLKSELQAVARDYNFPQKGLGRLKRSAERAKEYGSHYKSWLSYSAARPRVSRFDHNPNIFFLINPEDKDDPVLLAGGLYMPSSRQLRSIREAIANDASAFDKLFKTKAFARSFPGGFSLEKTATRPPRGFDPNHPRLAWLKLQGYFVWKPYTQREFASPGFAELVARDAAQILRLNALLDLALAKRLPAVEPRRTKASDSRKSEGLLDRLEGIQHVRREMDF